MADGLCSVDTTLKLIFV